MKPYPIINGCTHAWSQVLFPIYGKPVQGIAAIRYGSFRDANNSVQHYAEIALEDFCEVQKLLHGKKLYELSPIEVTVSFKTSYGIATHRLLLKAFRRHDYQRVITDILVGDIIQD